MRNDFLSPIITLTYYISVMQRVFAAARPPTEVYDTVLDSSTHKDFILGGFICVAAFWQTFCDVEYSEYRATPGGNLYYHTTYYIRSFEGDCSSPEPPN